MTMTIGLILLSGLLAIAYGIWAARSIMAEGAGNEKMQEIAAAIQEGAGAYLRRQYTAISIAGIVIFLIVTFTLSLTVAMKRPRHSST